MQLLKWLFSLLVVILVAGLALVWSGGAGSLKDFPAAQIAALRATLTGTAPRKPREPPIPVADMVWPPVTYEMQASCTPADAPISVDFGNNHDAVYLPGTPGSPYPHYLLISGSVGTGQLYGAQTLSADPDAWDLLVPDYHVTEQYELDDGIVIGDTYYIFEAQTVYAFSGDIAEGSRKWEAVGRFPDSVDDIAVYFDGETVHLYGEYGHYADRPDGTTIAHMTAGPDFKDWVMEEPEAVRPNVGDTVVWGVGDASVIELDGQVLMTTDIESNGQPYRIALWRNDSLNGKFEFAGILAEPAPGTDGLYNYRVQDGDLAIAEDGRVIMFANWRDLDGTPGSTLPAFPDGRTRVIGTYTCHFD